MTYMIHVYDNDGDLIAYRSYDTRLELAAGLDLLYRAYPRSMGYTYSVEAAQTTHYVLVDSQLLPTGDATAEKLWNFYNNNK